MYSKREEIIRNYIEGYNTFNVTQMLQDIHPDISFRNIQNGTETFSLQGKDSFRKQAEEALAYFSKRHQEILKIEHQRQQSTIVIHYSAIAGTNLPNGIKKGTEMEFKGQSVFIFKNEKISGLTDIH
ncbi:MAG TPA: nuclear transport factor 2 family protein [Sphingobacterium sp.]|nr:nuclear transport factor 2 family protein [Sphingobacterium sp.]